MTCGYCQNANTEDDHRCRRCGRRIIGTATAAPSHLAREHVRIAVQALGANALAATARVVGPDSRPAPGPMLARELTPAPAAARKEISMDRAATLDELPRVRVVRPAQPSLFGAELQPKIIPFEVLHRAVNTSESSPASDTAASETIPHPATPLVKQAPRPGTRRNGATDAQTTLDFLPPLKNAPRTLKTNAEAVIFCDAVVAAPVHRAAAAALDLSMIAMAYGVVLAIFTTWAKPPGMDRYGLVMLGGMLALVALLYGAVFAIAGTVTPGLKWTHLRLINFDGFPPEGRSRALRFLGCWVSVLSGGLGILWALLDEENLSWHDHISKTFPTLCESNSIVMRSRVRPPNS